MSANAQRCVLYGAKRRFWRCVNGMTPLSVFKQHSQIAVMTLSGTLLINIFRNFRLDFAKICKYGRLPFMRFDILTMSVSFHARRLSTFHVRDLSLARQNVRSQAHIFSGVSWWQSITKYP